MDPFECAGTLIIKLSHAMKREMDRRLRAYDVTLSQWAVLKQLWQEEGLSQVELQELLLLERATIHGLVHRMTRAGLIVSSSDPQDKRVMRIFLTERGRMLKQITASLQQEVGALVLRGFSDDERTFFIRLLERSLHNIQGDE